MRVARLSVVQFVRPLPSCSPRTNRRPDHLDPAEAMPSTSRPTPDTQSPTHFTEVFLLRRSNIALIEYCVDRVTKPERRARYKFSPAAGRRIIVARVRRCGSSPRPGIQDQGLKPGVEDRERSKAAPETALNARAVVDDDLMKNSKMRG